MIHILDHLHNFLNYLILIHFLHDRGVENDLADAWGGICDACAEMEAWEYEDDGQPDEAQEWYDFDPDC